MINALNTALPYLTRFRKPYFNQFLVLIFLFDQRTFILPRPFKIKEFLFDLDSENQNSI